MIVKLTKEEIRTLQKATILGELDLKKCPRILKQSVDVKDFLEQEITEEEADKLYKEMSAKYGWDKF